MTEQPPVQILVHPTPTDAEASAISAAISMTMTTTDEPVVASTKNAWREAGKREALRESHWETTS